MDKKQFRISGEQGGNGSGEVGRPPSADNEASIANLFADAVRSFQAGRLPEAEAGIRQILATNPDHLHGLHLLGLIAAQVGRHDAAAELIGKAVAIKPDFAEAHYHLGNVLRAQGKIKEAANSWRHALAVKPDFAEAHGNLGNAFREQGRLNKAVASFRRALAIKPDFADAHCNLGSALRDQGKLDEAVDCFRNAIAIKPNYALAHNNLGNALQQQGKLDDAAACYQRALAIRPDLAEAQHNLSNLGRSGNAGTGGKQPPIIARQAGDGSIEIGRPFRVDQGAILADLLRGALRHFQAGRLPQAEADLRRVLASDPDNVDGLHLLGLIAARAGRHDAAAHLIGKAVMLKPDFADAQFGLANALRDIGRLDDAAARYERCIALKPDFAEAHSNLGNVLRTKGKPEEAAACQRRALAISPDFAVAAYNLGNALRDQGNLEEAVAGYGRALEIRPDFAEAYRNQGNAFREMGKLGDAVQSLERAIALNPNLADAHSNLGLALMDLGRLDEAVASCRRAVTLNPNVADHHNNLGSVLRQAGELDEALACYRRAVAVDPKLARSHFNLGLTLLLLGELAEGWREYEWRWRGGARHLTPRSFGRPQWQGEGLEGRTLLLHAEQGLGDSIQFVRYAKAAAERGGRVIVAAPRPLSRLLATVDGVAECVSDGERLPPFDCHLPLMSVPGLVGTTLETIPADVPYVSADATAAAAWGQRLSDLPGPKVGLVWSGDSWQHDPGANIVDRRRSIALERFSPLLAVPGVTFVSLQKGGAAAQLADLPPDLRPLDFMAEIDDFADTAALVANLDLVITVDTSVAHLAGAMAKPVWILSRFDGCWRWLLDREDSPWYPTARLFRQTRPRDWDAVIAAVAAKLAEVAAGKLEAVWPITDAKVNVGEG